MPGSPFVFQQPLPPEQLRGRADEVEQIVAAVESGNAIAVSGPRRYGKTSVLLAVQQQLAAREHPVALVDLYATASAGELVVRIERAWARTRPRWRQAIERVLDATRLGLSLSGPGFGATLQRQPSTDPIPALHALLDLPRRIGTSERRAVLIFDEFQSLANLEGVEGLLRSHIQHQREHAGYAFAGSEPHLLARQFDDPDRPFFGQALRLRLERPSRAALAETIDAGFAASDRAAGEALGVLLDLADDHPQRAMLLAHFLWASTAAGQVADLETWQQALHAARWHVVGEVQARYDRATPNEQRVLRAAAHDLSPFAATALARLGLDEGSVTNTVRQLTRGGSLEQRVDPVGRRPIPGSYRLVDPLLGDWLRTTLPL